MKKIFFIVLVSFCSLFAYAEEYNYITFVTADGMQVIETANLEMTISGSNLVATNSTKTLSLSLNTLQKMYFSDSEGIFTNIENTSFDENTNIEIFSIDGKQLGMFSNMADAVRSLNSGMYVAKQGSLTQKILVK